MEVSLTHYNLGKLFGAVCEIQAQNLKEMLQHLGGHTKLIFGNQQGHLGAQRFGAIYILTPIPKAIKTKGLPLPPECREGNSHLMFEDCAIWTDDASSNLKTTARFLPPSLREGSHSISDSNVLLRNRGEKTMVGQREGSP